MRILITGGAGFLGQRLAQYLLADPALEQLVLTDIVLPVVPGDVDAQADGADERVKVCQADITDAAAVRALITPDLTAVFHLAAVVSGQAEADFDLGVRVNCDGTRYLLEAVRHWAPGAKFIFASSLAVFGGDLPALITPQTAVTPQSSYGTQKAVCELWVNDYSRKGFLDGRVLRLPTVCVRPGKPNAAASSFASSIIREPVHGEAAVCPVDISLGLWLSSPGVVTANLAHGLALPAEAFGSTRTLNLPGITVTVRAMIDALGEVVGEAAQELIEYAPDDAISRIVASWPSRFDVESAIALGFSRDESFASIIEAFVAESTGTKGNEFS
ncbi:MAG: D-erythronate dehydrogenase [Cyanobacteria bacterium J06614_10]